MYAFGRCCIANGAATAAADDGCLGINLILRPGAGSWLRSSRKMVRCAGHGFDDVADEDDSGATTEPRYSPCYSPTVSLAPCSKLKFSGPYSDAAFNGSEYGPENLSFEKGARLTVGL